MKLRIIRTIERTPVEDKRYSIEEVSRLTGLSRDQINYYIKEELVEYVVDADNTLHFTIVHILQLQRVNWLMQQMQVNVYGVDMILEMRKKIHSLHQELNNIRDKYEEQLLQIRKEYEEEIQRINRDKSTDVR
ncbi:MAG TPA: MerR family transcriptional regulator [Balneolales bacterium]|nr:MerR family transcriptional regulator [Balneolales bacterium]